MKIDLHKIDDVFNSAYTQFEEDPSADVWGKISAGLDKKDTESYKRRLLIWKRVAIFLLLILTGFILFESRILETGSGRPNENATTTKIGTHVERDGTPDQTQSPVRNANDGNRNAIDKKVSDKEENDTRVIIQNANTPIKETNKSTDQQKSSLSKAKVKVVGENDQLEINSTTSLSGKIKKVFLRNNERLSKEKNIVPLIEKNNTNVIAARLLNGIRPVQIPISSDSLLTNDKKNTANPKRNDPFTPFWMITAFASYERAGYRLDSDLPANIDNLKHREQHEPSFSAGLLMTRQLTKRFGLQTGLIYPHTSIGINPQKMYALKDPGGDIVFKYVTSSGYAYIKPGIGAPPAIGDSINTTEGKHTLQFISVPAVIKYILTNNKFSFIPGAGIEVNFLISAKVETEIERPFSPEIVFINKLNGAKSVHWSFVADADLRYQLNKKLSLSVRPSFRHALSPITENNVVETFPYNFGLGAGMTYRF